MSSFCNHFVKRCIDCESRKNPHLISAGQTLRLVPLRRRQLAHHARRTHRPAHTRSVSIFPVSKQTCDGCSCSRWLIHAGPHSDSSRFLSYAPSFNFKYTAYRDSLLWRTSVRHGNLTPDRRWRYKVPPAAHYHDRPSRYCRRRDSHHSSR
jgi:hypothetical protein